jgi:hypothetical protein
VTRRSETIQAEIRRWEDYLKQRLQQQVDRDEELKRIRLEEERVNREWRERQAGFREATSRRWTVLRELVSKDNAAVLEKLAELRTQSEMAQKSEAGSSRVQAFIRAIRTGVDWSGRWICVWEQGDFCILTKRTGSVFSGRGMQRVSLAKHGLYDLRLMAERDSRPSISEGMAMERKCRVAFQDGGRLTPATRQQWIKQAEASKR